jgi:hypothetical protein
MATIGNRAASHHTSDYPHQPTSLHGLGKAEPTMRAAGDKSQGDARELFGKTGLAARAPHSGPKRIIHAGESSSDALFQRLSLHVCADRHGAQSYPVGGDMAIREIPTAESNPRHRVPVFIMAFPHAPYRGFPRRRETAPRPAKTAAVQDPSIHVRNHKA